MRANRKIAAVATLLLLSTLSVTGCSSQQPASPELTSVTFSQSKAVPDYDSDTYTVTDADQLAALEAVLDTYDWKPGTSYPRDNACVGGTTTEIALVFADNSTATIHTYRCGSSDGLVDELTDLVSSWH